VALTTLAGYRSIHLDVHRLDAGQHATDQQGIHLGSSSQLLSGCSARQGGLAAASLLHRLTLTGF